MRLSRLMLPVELLRSPRPWRPARARPAPTAPGATSRLQARVGAGLQGHPRPLTQEDRLAGVGSSGAPRADPEVRGRQVQPAHAVQPQRPRGLRQLEGPRLRYCPTPAYQAAADESVAHSRETDGRPAGRRATASSTTPPSSKYFTACGGCPRPPPSTRSRASTSSRRSSRTCRLKKADLGIEGARRDLAVPPVRTGAGKTHLANYPSTTSTATPRSTT